MLCGWSVVNSRLALYAVLNKINTCILVLVVGCSILTVLTILLLLSSNTDSHSYHYAPFYTTALVMWMKGMFLR